MKTYKAALVGYGGMGRWHKTGICQTPRVCIDGVYDILRAGTARAREKTNATLARVQAAMQIDYFSDRRIVGEWEALLRQ